MRPSVPRSRQRFLRESRSRCGSGSTRAAGKSVRTARNPVRRKGICTVSPYGDERGHSAQRHGNSLPQAPNRERQSAFHLASTILREPQPGEGPTRRGRKEIPIGCPEMPGRGNGSAAAQHHLVAHELAVVFADGTPRSAKARIRDIRTSRPFPNIAEHLSQRAAGAPFVVGVGVKMAAVSEIPGYRYTFGCNLPLGFGRQPLADPFGVSVGLEKTDMANRFGEVEPTQAAECKDRPDAVLTAPI